MDRLFSPCTRLHAMLESKGCLESFRGRPEDLQELNLDVSTERLLSEERAFTYTYAMFDENVGVWITPHAAVMPVDGRGIHVQIPFGCFYQGMPKLPFPREPRRSLCSLQINRSISSHKKIIHRSGRERSVGVAFNRTCVVCIPTFCVNVCKSAPPITCGDDSPSIAESLCRHVTFGDDSPSVAESLCRHVSEPVTSTVTSTA
jgi:hypothetical protein